MTQAMLPLPKPAPVPHAGNSPQDAAPGTLTGYHDGPLRLIEVLKTSASSLRNPTNNGVAVFNHADHFVMDGCIRCKWKFANGEFTFRVLALSKKAKRSATLTPEAMSSASGKGEKAVNVVSKHVPV